MPRTEGVTSIEPRQAVGLDGDNDTKLRVGKGQGLLSNVLGAGKLLNCFFGLVFICCWKVPDKVASSMAPKSETKQEPKKRRSIQRIGGGEGQQ